MSEPTGEQPIEMGQVTFELPVTDVPELMAVLGGFVTDHNLSVTFSDEPVPVAPIAPEREAPKYDPKLVGWVYDESVKGEVAIVSQGHLKAFAIEQDGNSGRGERLANCLFRERSLERGISSFVLMAGESVVGVKVDQLKALVEILDSRAIHPTNLGQKSIDLLKAYRDELFPDDSRVN